ncbi:MAG TPA: LysM peptidoglycan-binding domain-containing protein [Limnochordia bacterium]|nr:LysM peptidoglycan-binding domain-containing protein [Limnochordia bacterium]
MRKITLVIVFILLVGVTMVAGAAEPKYHTIAAGDTLHQLAQEYTTTVIELLDFNPGITPDELEVGQKLLLPVETLWSYHVVQPGDNARALAKAYKVPEETLRAANGLTSNKLTAGEMIRIPIHFYLGNATAEQVTHKVEIGDTLYKIAQHYKITLSKLVEWNEIGDIDSITAGQVLIVG